MGAGRNFTRNVSKSNTSTVQISLTLVETSGSTKSVRLCSQTLSVNVFSSHTGAWDSLLFLPIRTVFSTDVVDIGRELQDSLIDVAHPQRNLEINTFI